jgi:hypothetical protein
MTHAWMAQDRARWFSSSSAMRFMTARTTGSAATWACQRQAFSVASASRLRGARAGTKIGTIGWEPKRRASADV